jgi:hypothetical protein
VSFVRFVDIVRFVDFVHFVDFVRFIFGLFDLFGTMPRCIVIGCTSGYRSNPDKKHFFCVPKNENMRQQWQAAVHTSKRRAINAKTSRVRKLLSLKQYYMAKSSKRCGWKHNRRSK